MTIIAYEHNGQAPLASYIESYLYFTSEMLTFLTQCDKPGFALQEIAEVIINSTLGFLVFSEFSSL